MTLKLKLSDAASDYTEIFTDPRKLLEAAAEHIGKTDGSCKLFTLQYDPKHDSWIGITEATEIFNIQIEKILQQYRRSIHE